MREKNGVLYAVTDEDINSDGSFTFPSGITGIGDSAFEYCLGLEQIEIPEGVTNIGFGAFQHCSNLKSIKIPEGVTNIADYAFASCENLEQIEIPEGVTNIGHGAFQDCSNLKSIKIPEGVTNIADYAFAYCESLEQVKISNGVAWVGDFAFRGCKSLEEIVMPDSVIGIASNVFKECINLKRITIPCINYINHEIGMFTLDGFMYVEEMPDRHFLFSKERVYEDSFVLALDSTDAFNYFYFAGMRNRGFDFYDMCSYYEDAYGPIRYDGYEDEYGDINWGTDPQWLRYGYMPSEYIGVKYHHTDITRELVNDFIKGTLSIRNSGITYSRNYNSRNMDMFLYRMMRLIGAEEIEKMLKINEISEEDLRTYFDSQSQIYEKYIQKKFGIGGIDGLTIGIVKGLDKRLGTLKEKEKFEIYKRINGYLAQEDYTEFNKMLEGIYGKEKLSELQENVRNRVIENIVDKLKVKNERLSQELRIPEAQLNVAKRIMKRYIKENGSVNIENIEKWFKENTGHGTDFAANWIQTKKETIIKLINESIAENKDILSNEKMIFDILKQGKEHFQRPWIRNIIGTENQVEFTREELQKLFGEEYVLAHENEYKSKLILKPGVSQEEFYKEIERKKYKRCHCL